MVGELGERGDEGSVGEKGEKGIAGVMTNCTIDWRQLVAKNESGNRKKLLKFLNTSVICRQIEILTGFF